MFSLPAIASAMRPYAERAMKQGQANAAKSKTDRRHSASVDLTEAQWASRPVVGANGGLAGKAKRTMTTSDSAPVKATMTGGLAGRGASTQGRGYYHPDRIRQRALKRDERYQQQALNNVNNRQGAQR